MSGAERIGNANGISAPALAARPLAPPSSPRRAHGSCGAPSAPRQPAGAAGSKA
jgi:hypothetical protein